MAVLRLRELATARDLELPALRRDHLLVTFQEEHRLRDVLVPLPSVCAPKLVCKNSQNRSPELDRFAANATRIILFRRGRDGHESRDQAI